MNKNFTDRTLVALNTPIPSNTKKKMGKFDYLPSSVVIKQLNELFTPSGWSSSVLSAEVIDKHFYKNKGRDMIKVVALATVRLDIIGYTSHEDVATLTGSSNMSDIGGAYDTALKGAVSIALTRCSRKLGEMFGLSLYKDVQEATSLHESFMNANNHPEDKIDPPSCLPLPITLVDKTRVKGVIMDNDALTKKEYKERVSGVVSYLGLKSKMDMLNFSEEQLRLAVKEIKNVR